MLFQLQQYRNASPERTQLLEILTHVLYGLDSNDESLVFKCSEKIYEEQPSLVLRCFVDDDGMIGHLNIYHVVQHLQNLAANEPTIYQQNKFALDYLKVVVPHCATISSERNDFNLSQKLITLYIESIKDLLDHPDHPNQATQITHLQQDLHHLLKTNSLYVPALVLELLPEDTLLHERCVHLFKHFKCRRSIPKCTVIRRRYVCICIGWRTVRARMRTVKSTTTLSTRKTNMFLKSCYKRMI